MITIVDPGGIGRVQIPTANTESYRYTNLIIIIIIIIILVVICSVIHTAPNVNRDLRPILGLVLSSDTNSSQCGSKAFEQLCFTARNSGEQNEITVSSLLMVPADSLEEKYVIS